MGHGQSPAPPEVRRVVWTDEAVTNLEHIAAYISDFSPLAAQRMALKLKTAGDSLIKHPDRGRPLSKGRRELVVVTPFLIRYRVTETTIEIIAVRHGARKPD